MFALPLLALAGGAGGAAALGGSAITGGIAGASLGSGISGLMTGMYQSQVASNNAKIMQMNQQNTLEQGQQAESLAKIKADKEVAAVRAGAAGHGVDVNTGTPLNEQAATATSGELDALAVRYNYAMKAYGYGTEAANYRAQSTVDTMTGINSLFAGIGQAGGSYLSASKALSLQGAGF